ncbi:hypothetical protein HYW11_00975 [Candidatus Peregrinibacteria bacterium]|nr:hypothetical protein [Candidatus Peregrinibacteria bacterium]
MAKRMLIEATGQEFVGYFGPNGRQMDRGYLIEKRPAAPPAGTVYELEYTLLRDAVTEDGEPIEKLDGFPLKVGPKKFLRGRLVKDPKEAEALIRPPLVRKIVSQLRKQGVDVSVMFSHSETPSVVAIIMADGAEVGIPMGDKDTAPPEGASPYPVGESPEEVSEAEIAAIREDIQNGVFADEELEAAAAEEMYRSTWETARDEAGGEN